MRSVVVLGVAAVVMAGGASEAEARFRLRMSSPSYTYRPAVTPISRPALVVSPGVGIGVGLASGIRAAHGYGHLRGSREPIPPIRSVLTAEAQPSLTEDTKSEGAAPANAAPTSTSASKVAQPWCRSGRVAGSGPGFCLMN